MVEKSELSFQLVLGKVTIIKLCHKLEFFIVFLTATSLEGQIFQLFGCLVSLLGEPVTNSMKDVVQHFEINPSILIFGSVQKSRVTLPNFKLARNTSLSFTYTHSNSIPLVLLADMLGKGIEVFFIVN